MYICRQKEELNTHSSFMAKRILKQPAHSESDDTGCLSGFIAIFDFRVGRYSQKLLSDKKRGPSRGLVTGCSTKKLDFPSKYEIKVEDTDDGDETRTKRDNSGMVSVNTLMEEEMSKTHYTKIQNNQIEQSQAESGIHLKEKNKKKNKKCNVLPDQHVNDFSFSTTLDFGQSNSTIPTEKSSVTYNLAEFVIQLYSCPLSESIANRKRIHFDETDSKFSEKCFSLQKALHEVAKACLSHKILDSEVLASNMEVQSSEFIDALETLNSNKELLVKLSEDPNLPLWEHIQVIQDALVGSKILEETSTSDQPEDNDLFQRQGHHKLFAKKDKHKESDRSQDRRKIVVLKPTPARIKNDSVRQTLSSSPLSYHDLKPQEGERMKSYFSFKGIKRRLRHVMGEKRKEQHLVCMDGVLDRLPYGTKYSDDTRETLLLASKTSCNSQQISQPSAVGKKRGKPKLKIEHPPCSELFFYEEAREHLTEMVTAPDEKDSSSTVSKSPRRAVSLSEFNLSSPRFSPGGNDELVLSPRNIILSPSGQFNREGPTDNLSPLRQALDQDAETPVTGSSRECTAEDLETKGSMEIVEALDIKPLEEHGDLNVLRESIGNEPGGICEGCEEGSSALLEPEMPDDKPQLLIPSLSISRSFIHPEKLENPGDTLGQPEGPSPVSVLEPFFLEDSISPGCTTPDHVDLHVQPQQINFQENDGSPVALTLSDIEGEPITCFNEEAMYGFITTLLEASGMCCYGDLERWNSNQLLDPSLLGGILHSLLPEDRKLLFDCMSEVLMETQKRLFEFTPWVSLIKPSSQMIMRGLDLIEEVCKSVKGQIQLSQFTLDRIARKDIEGRSWMNLQVEIEAVVIEMADDILEEIIEDTVSK